MIESKVLTLDEIQNFKGKYPKQLWYLFLIEMWERFTFYGMRALLALYISLFCFRNSAFLFSNAFASIGL